MSISKDKVGILINMDKSLKLKLEELAKKDKRTTTAFINKILEDYVDSKKMSSK